MTREGRFCREASLARDEPLVGTASTVRRWILVERDGPWGRDALQENRFGAEASRRLRALGKANAARVLLIRAHGRYTQRGVRVLVALSGRHQRWMEELHFQDVGHALSHEYAPLRQSRSVGGQRVDGLRYFVCTHGKHDPCCAKHGREVAAALSAATPDRVFETSHIGGDRFAANVLILPLGIYYGRVEPERAVEVMRRLERGEIDLERFRGRTTYPFDAQAAEWFVRRQLSILGVDDVVLEAHERQEKGRSESRFRLADGRIATVEVVSQRAAPARLTCRAASESAAPRYELLDLRLE